MDVKPNIDIVTFRLIGADDTSMMFLSFPILSGMFKPVFLSKDVIDLTELVLNVITSDQCHWIYITMNRIHVEEAMDVTIKGICVFIERRGTNLDQGQRWIAQRSSLGGEFTS